MNLKITHCKPQEIFNAQGNFFIIRPFTYFAGSAEGYTLFDS
jgi:hypothetical protein